MIIFLCYYTAEEKLAKGEIITLLNLLYCVLPHILVQSWYENARTEAAIERNLTNKLRIL